MTLKELIDTLDQFRDEYNTSLDPDIKKLCKYISNTIDGLNSYLQFFESTRSRIEQNQMYYAASLEQLNNLLADVNVIINP